MNCKIEIDMDNDAFQEQEGTDNGTAELARVLVGLATSLTTLTIWLDTPPIRRTILDSNGGSIGTCTIY